MNKPFQTLILLTFICIQTTPVKTQDAGSKLALDDIIRLAKLKSIDAMVSDQKLLQGYWQFKTYKAEKLPSLSLDMNLVDFNRSTINHDYDYNSGDYKFYTTNYNTSGAGLSLNQNIPLTGGNIMMGYDLIRNDNFDLGSWNYASNPSVRFTQPLFAHNPFRWADMLEPTYYEIAKAEYNQSIENIALKAINLYFDLAYAQIRSRIAEINYSNADTLLKISRGRYEIGKIGENDLLQMELSQLEALAELSNSEVYLHDKQNQLLSFLRVSDDEPFEIEVLDTVPDLEIIISKGLEQARLNNPAILRLQNDQIIAQRDVDLTKAEKGLKMNLEVALGYSRVDTTFPEIITNTDNISDYKNIRIGLHLPIVDWKRGEGRYKIAKLNEEIVHLQVEQALIDFEQLISLQIIHFNQQKDLFVIAKKAAEVAERRYEINKNRFLVGNIDVLDLNLSQKDSDSQQANYINSLRNYWIAFYTVRSLVLYDFYNNCKINHLPTYANSY